ncbi:MAG: hypothetical protein OEY59_09875 [Deltaproteobacteria bacterium]|nr:hypothetical protein [Deltaproteobacteria bacterium]
MNGYSIYNNISLNDCTENMVILDYCKFNDKYTSMDGATIKWLIHHFNGTKAQVIRDNKNLELETVKIKQGDTLVKIFQFPTNLRKFTVVNQKLLKELEFRGFLKFKVQLPQKTESKKLLERKRSIHALNSFVGKIDRNNTSREDGTKVIESFMDNARNGKVVIKDIVHYIDDFMSNSSPDVISAIASLKASDQTYAHCVDVAAIYQKVYFDIIQKTGRKSAFQSTKHAILASFVHDIGKSQLPKEILDSTTRFKRDSKEYKIIQSHPAKSMELLTKMKLDDLTVNMSGFHHVKVNTEMESSYPKIDCYSRLEKETKLLAIIDVYQSLVGKRSYKKSWNPASALRYINVLAGDEFDLETWEEFYESIGLYPVGSLVRLSDDSMAFVMNNPEKDKKRPQVSIVRNAKGQDLTNNEFIDLRYEKDLSIVKDIDAQDVFEDALGVFTSLRIS